MKSLERRLARLTKRYQSEPASLWELTLRFGEAQARAMLASGCPLPPSILGDVLREIDGKTRGLPPRRVERDAPP